MSLLNINFLNEIVLEKNIHKPNEILNKQRVQIINALNSNSTSAINKQDGMDCTLCAFNFNKNELQYSAANNELWLVRDNKLIEYPADKMPVGRSPKDNISFTQHSVSLEKDDYIFLFTEGYADQFGGPKAKKMKQATLKKIIMKHAHQPTKKLKKLLDEEFENWKGELEQIDDICIIGIKI